MSKWHFHEIIIKRFKQIFWRFFQRYYQIIYIIGSSIWCSVICIICNFVLFNIRMSSTYTLLHNTYIFPISLNFGACYIMGQWGEFWVKNVTFCFLVLFYIFFVDFHQKICFYHFYFFFLIKYQIPAMDYETIINRDQC